MGTDDWYHMLRIFFVTGGIVTIILCVALIIAQIYLFVKRYL